MLSDFLREPAVRQNKLSCLWSRPDHNPLPGSVRVVHRLNTVLNSLDVVAIGRKDYSAIESAPLSDTNQGWAGQVGFLRQPGPGDQAPQLRQLVRIDEGRPRV